MRTFFKTCAMLLCAGLLFNSGIGALHAATKKLKSNESDAGENQEQAKKTSKEKEPAETDEKRSEYILKTLEYGTQEERIKATAKISLISNSAAKAKVIKKLVETIKDESDPEFLVKAITLLGEIKEKSAPPNLIEKLDHPAEEVRVAAAYALKNTDGISAKDKMVRILKEQRLEDSSNFIEALLSALGQFNAREIIPFAKEALSSAKTSRGNKESLMLFLGKIQAREAKDILIKLYMDDDQDVMIRSLAVNAIARIGITECSPQIKEVIKTIESYDMKKRKKYFTLHLYSVAALAKLGDADSIPKLIQALRSNNSDVRLKAIVLIKEFKDKRTIDILQYKMKYDQNPRVRTEAKKALEEMGVDVKEEKK